MTHRFLGAMLVIALVSGCTFTILTPTPTDTFTETNTPSPTFTCTATSSRTPKPTNTLLPTVTFTATASPTSAWTPAASDTFTPTLSPTPEEATPTQEIVYDCEPGSHALLWGLTAFYEYESQVNSISEAESVATYQPPECVIFPAMTWVNLIEYYAPTDAWRVVTSEGDPVYGWVPADALPIPCRLPVSADEE